MHFLRGVLALLAIVINTVVLCVPLYLLGLVHVLVRGRWRQAVGPRLDAIVQAWVAGNRAIFRLLGVTRLHRQWENDAGLSRRRWYLVLSNHQSWADILVLQNALWGRIPMLKFFTKRELVWIPFAGIAMLLLGFPMVRRLRPQQLAADPSLARLDRQATLEACARFRRYPSTVLSFLEGSRFTPGKRAAQTARFQHLLNPKLGGVSYVVDTLKDRIHAVLDVTIVYRGPVPSFWELLQGQCRDIDVVIRCLDLPDEVRAARDAAAARAELRPWIEALWRDKDARLADLAGVTS